MPAYLVTDATWWQDEVLRTIKEQVPVKLILDAISDDKKLVIPEILYNAFLNIQSEIENEMKKSKMLRFLKRISGEKFKEAINKVKGEARALACIMEAIVELNKGEFQKGEIIEIVEKLKSRGKKVYLVTNEENLINRASSRGISVKWMTFEPFIDKKFSFKEGISLLFKIYLARLKKKKFNDFLNMLDKNTRDRVRLELKIKNIPITKKEIKKEEEPKVTDIDTVLELKPYSYAAHLVLDD